MSGAFFELDDVVVEFGGVRAINGFSMRVESGSIHALIGPNGAGKSTVFNCISRFYTPSRGDIRFEGRSLLSLRPHEIPRLGIARTFQNIELCKRMTVLENVLVGGTATLQPYLPFLTSRNRRRIEHRAVEDAEALLEAAGLMRYRDTPAEHLDFGHQKLLDVTRALAARPRLLILDEPAAGLRNREIAALDAMLVKLARDKGITIILVEHVMQLVMAIAQQITVLSSGQKIAEGTPREVAANPDVIEAYLGKGAHVAA